MSQNTETYKVSAAQSLQIRDELIRLGFSSEPVKTPYEEYRLKGSQASATMYKSGKLVLQGRDISREDGVIREATGMGSVGGNTSTSLQVAKPSSGNFTPRIGADEVGKGDYFGSMVTAACYVTPQDIDELKGIGVGDSKKITDSKILDIFAELHEICRYKVHVMTPEMYNEQHKSTGNVAVMLARAHAISIKEMILEIEEEKLELERVVVDQFSKSKARLLNEFPQSIKNYRIEQFHKGESDISVAAASIIARAYFLKEWNDLEKKYGIDFPKGASNVIPTGKAFVKAYGDSRLSEVAKISFKTTGSIIGDMFK